MDFILITQGSTIAGMQRHAIDLDLPRSRDQVTKAVTSQPVNSTFSGLERGSGHPGIGQDRQGIGITGHAAGKCYETT